MARVIVDNDLAGDPDGLFALAHHLLCTSVSIPLVVSSHLPERFGGPRSAHNGAAKAEQLLATLRLPTPPTVVAGREVPLAGRMEGQSDASAAIIAEAMREDRTTPLFYAAGAGLTDLAEAWQREPRIGRRLTLVWIGGAEHDGMAPPPPGPAEMEFNLSIDPRAAQIVFNESDIAIWQVPRNAYRQMLYSLAELQELARTSRVAGFLKGELDGMAAALARIPGFRVMPDADVVVLGDSPLVTLTALRTPIQPDPASSTYTTLPTPRLTDQGTYEARPDARPMRVYTHIDAALTLQDMASRFRLHG